ncbi:glucose-6-phosphate isomerase family protein [Cohnella cellulosilytica]|uniref:glucose-6-phosphate isomerase n=1 Tax=Cohnella cellulosilytica TaxID=986710 RepID=A0ABW2FE94_9BACL
MTRFDPGFDIRPTSDPLGFRYGEGVFGPPVERRSIDEIRSSLRDPNCEGPDPVYAIAMDVGRNVHRAELRSRMLLFGAVTYAAGRLGDEPIRSQGHVHRVSAHSGWSPPELYEIWTGRAFIYMQESDGDDPGRCFAVVAEPGDVVIVPPYWAHATISADPDSPLAFGAWCDREYGFEYDGVRRHRGLAWYPLLDAAGRLDWSRNERYAYRPLAIKRPEPYEEFGIARGIPIYRQFEADPDRFQWVSRPERMKEIWERFVP